MARPLRIEFAGALYHVTARGNAQADIYDDHSDHQQFLNSKSGPGLTFDIPTIILSSQARGQG